MSQVVERPLRADARRNRERVLKAARAVFADQGRDAQMDDVARRAKVGVGTVYRHVPTKDAIILALAEESFNALAEVAREATTMADPWNAFEHVMRRGAELLAGDRALSEVVMETPGAMAAAAGAQRDLVAAMEALIRRGQEAGVLRDDIVVDDIGMLMCGIGSATKKPHAYPESWRRHLAIVLDGLRAESARNRLPS